jgi:hypothetical protein
MQRSGRSGRFQSAGRSQWIGSALRHSWPRQCSILLVSEKETGTLRTFYRSGDCYRTVRISRDVRGAEGVDERCWHIRTPPLPAIELPWSHGVTWKQ